MREIFEGWVGHLRDGCSWGPDDPLFPKTRIVSGADRRFQVNGLERVGWRTSAPIRAIFRKAFEAAGMPYSQSAFVPPCADASRADDLRQARGSQGVQPELRPLLDQDHRNALRGDPGRTSRSVDPGMGKRKRRIRWRCRWRVSCWKGWVALGSERPRRRSVSS